MTTGREADLATHHIEGYVATGERLRVDLVTEIGPNLWMGGCLPGVRLPDDFAHVVSLYPWERYRLGPDTQRVEIRLYDSARMESGELLHLVAEAILGMRSAGKTLVHCQAGLNRSGLLTALALVHDGWAPADAIAHLRATRSPLVLCNRAFEAWLLALGEKARAA